MSAPSLAQKVSNIKHMPVLLAATSATKEPADGYLVKDIIKMSFESQQTRLFLQQYLINQLLTTNNVYSKIKILRLFLVLLDEGHIELKQNLRRTPEPFNEAAKLRPNQPKDTKLVAECGRIRDMAEKILDILFEDVPEMRKQSSSTANSSYGVQNQSYSGGGGGGSGGGGMSSRITGFGNTGSSSTGSSSAASSKGSGSTTGKLKALFGTSGKNPVVYDPSYASMDPVPHNASANSPFTAHIPSPAGSSSSRYQGNQAKFSGARHERGQAGGGWGTDDDNSRSTGQSGYKSSPSQWSSYGYRERQAAVVDDDDEEEEEDVREHLSSTGQDLSGYEQGSMEQEQRLVDDITAPGGVRAAPPRESLAAFITRCKVLDTLSVVECLRLKLLGNESQTVLRALFVIEALLRSDVPDILSHLDIVLQDLSNLSSSPNSSIQAKSKKILVQLTSVNVAKVPEMVRSNQQELSGEVEGEREEEEVEDTDQGQGSGVSSIFSGLAVSGEKTTRSAAPKQKRKKAPGKKQASPSVARHRTNGTAKVKEEESSGFGDILGLGELTSSNTVEPTEQLPAPQPAAMGNQQLMMMYEEEEEAAGPQDDSLLTFEEDVEFDPLKRTDSVSRSNAALAKKGSLSKRPPVPTNQNPSVPDSGAPQPPPPLTSQESLGHIQDLTGIDLTPSSKTADSAYLPQHQQGPQSEILYPLQMTSAPSSMAMPTSMNVLLTSSATGVMPHPPGGIQLVSVSPAAVGQVPLTLQAGGVGYGGGGAPAMAAMPVMYSATQGTPGMMYQPQFGGVARPVQRAADAKEPTPPPDTGFSFIGKSNKNNAFAFVQDEMKATRTKK